MKDAFEQVREQIHEIRNILGPVDFKFADLERQITTSRTYFEEKTMALESKLLAAIFRLDRMDVILADLVADQQKVAERMNRLVP